MPPLKLPAPILFAACLAAAPAQAGNSHPVVLVHGFLGFGPEASPAGFRYWGGTGDLAAHIGAGKRQVLTASVGPVSSNWDRAVELYYQLKGGCVDYGARHAASNSGAGEVRKPAGKCWAPDPASNPHGYPLALYPQWDAQHPLHFVAHSQGGQTVRTLIQLLENGAPHGPGSEGDGDLFAGGRTGWVTSATTITTPHNGTTLRDNILNFAPVLPVLAGGLFALTPHRKPAGFWKASNRDAAQWDLGPEGAAQLNEWVKTSPHVVYFSIGARSKGDSDGVVDTASMRAPAGQPVRAFDGTPLKGSWNHLGNYEGYDHVGMVGWSTTPSAVLPVYDKLMEIISAL